jgi:hypothetical protein
VSVQLIIRGTYANFHCSLHRNAGIKQESAGIKHKKQ